MSGPGPSKRLRVLARRLKWLKERIATSPDIPSLTFDQSEIDALEWAIENLQHLVAKKEATT